MHRCFFVKRAMEYMSQIWICSLGHFKLQVDAVKAEVLLKREGTKLNLQTLERSGDSRFYTETYLSIQRESNLIVLYGVMIFITLEFDLTTDFEWVSSIVFLLPRDDYMFQYNFEDLLIICFLEYLIFQI